MKKRIIKTESKFRKASRDDKYIENCAILLKKRTKTLDWRLEKCFEKSHST